MDGDKAFDAYQGRFAAEFGIRSDGEYVRFGKHMICKLNALNFAERLERYQLLRQACRDMITQGSTLSDAVMVEFAEACSWMVLPAPDLMSMFKEV